MLESYKYYFCQVFSAASIQKEMSRGIMQQQTSALFHGSLPDCGLNQILVVVAETKHSTLAILVDQTTIEKRNNDRRGLKRTKQKAKGLVMQSASVNQVER